MKRYSIDSSTQSQKLSNSSSPSSSSSTVSSSSSNRNYPTTFSSSLVTSNGSNNTTPFLNQQTNDESATTKQPQQQQQQIPVVYQYNKNYPSPKLESSTTTTTKTNNNIIKRQKNNKSPVNSLSSSSTALLKKQQENNSIPLLPKTIQKQIIQLLLEEHFFTIRKVSRYWRTVSHSYLKNLTIYFTDLYLSSSISHSTDVFLKELNNDFHSLESISFINASKNLMAHGEYYINAIINPFIESFVRNNQTYRKLVIKGFPLSRINNLTSQQQSPNYKLYHSSSTSSGTTMQSILARMTPPQPVGLHDDSTTTTTATDTDNTTTTTTKNINNRNNPELKELTLKNIGLDSKFKLLFFTSLSTFNHLVSLTISDSIGDEGVQMLTHLIGNKSLAALESLHLKKNQISNLSCQYLNSMFLSPASSSSNLKDLDLSWNRIDGDGLLMMKEGLQKNNILRNFNVSGNKISGLETTIDLGQSITSLDISKNSLTVIAIKSLGVYIRSNDSLKNLYLNHTQLVCKSLKSLSKSLAFNQSIRYLDLSFNKISQLGLSHLLSSLSHNRIESINLQNNQIDNSCATNLTQLFSRKDHQLFNINLSGNRIGITGYKKIAGSLSKYNKCKILFKDNSNNSMKENWTIEQLQDEEKNQDSEQAVDDGNQQQTKFEKPINNQLNIDFSYNKIQSDQACRLLADYRKSNFETFDLVIFQF
eukprot:gene7849-9663_t